jgi:hypothetical protein
MRMVMEIRQLRELDKTCFAGHLHQQEEKGLEKLISK